MLVRSILGAAAAWVLMGCGPTVQEPQEWMTGVFSTRAEGDPYGVGLEVIYLDPEGAFRLRSFPYCSAAASGEFEGTWDAVDDNTVRVPIPEEDQNGVRAYFLRRLPGCDNFEFGRERHPDQLSGDPIYRGEVCLGPVACALPEDDDCGCRTAYCDEAPAPLDCAAD
jgi:hypothetical protein